MKKTLLILSLTVAAGLPNISSAAESCNALINLGLYSVTQNQSAADGQSMAKSTFCSYDYSRSDLTTNQSGQIEASFGLFSGGASGGASGSVSRSDIIQTQSSVCSSGFNSGAYSSTVTSSSRTVYQGTLDAWNKCQQLANKGVVFEVTPSSTLQGMSVTITAPTGLAAKFFGVTQTGAGHSDCTTTNNGKLITVGANTPFTFTAASIVTINCARQMVAVGNDLIADQQDLLFSTSAGNINVPMAAVGSLSRMTIDQLTANLDAKFGGFQNKFKKINFTFPARTICGGYQIGCVVVDKSTGSMQYEDFAYDNKCALLGIVLPTPPNSNLIYSDKLDAAANLSNSNTAGTKGNFRVFLSNNANSTISVPAKNFQALFYCPLAI